MFIFRGNSRTFRCSPMLLNGVFTIKLSALLTFFALQDPAEELKSTFRGDFRTCRSSATSGPRTHIECSHIECTHRAHTWNAHIEWPHGVLTHRVVTKSGHT